jgi:ABC-type nitrate/sulfonate/bicarbonate transport system substrate-binding protein
MKVLPLRLRTVTRTQGNNAALKDGTVAPRDFAFEFEEVDPLIRAFRLMVREEAFDVCELAITTYLCAKEHGKPFTALPIFLVRGFHHGAIVSSGARDPKELEGTKVGVNRGYTVTTGVWARGVLADEYGVDLDKVTWVLSGDEHVAEYRPPANVVPMEQDVDLAQLVATGELAAAIGVDGDDLTPVIPNAAEAGFDALRRRGHYPINHLIVVKDELLAEHPELATQVFDAFADAKNTYVQRLRDDAVDEPTTIDRVYARVLEITGADPLPYGLEPNRRALEELVDHAVRQKILRRRPALETLFAEGTSGLEA